MKKTLLATLALSALSPVAFAEPVRLDGAQLDSVTAGSITTGIHGGAGTVVLTLPLDFDFLAAHGVPAEILRNLRSIVDALPDGVPTTGSFVWHVVPPVRPGAHSTLDIYMVQQSTGTVQSFTSSSIVNDVVVNRDVIVNRSVTRSVTVTE